ncbi:ComF family protein [Massilia sp. MS-15]|uniref:ComF family protein n=1 Tax=Massilia sp. MS-15 TaxID=2878200 RepID=UPI001CD2E545|nr:ComF family protein [Massilia sp. MS-15]MCA1246732.1 ComF family protein [Massilia sp. MS-15]
MSLPQLSQLSLRHWPRTWLGALLPCSCVLCGALGDAAVCAPCTAAYVLDGRSRCPCCANPLGVKTLGVKTFGVNPPGAPEDARRCGACLAAPPAFDATVAACDYADPVDRLVLQLKFGARLALAPWMARRLHDALLARPGLALPDLLCPVPLGPRRLVERGYNQALEIARPLARTLGSALAPRLLARPQDTAAQSGMAPGERRRNVRGAFALAGSPDALAGRHVGLVDDVMSSGHTLDELAGVLKRAGAARVTNLVFARTPPH